MKVNKKRLDAILFVTVFTALTLCILAIAGIF